MSTSESITVFLFLRNTQGQKYLIRDTQIIVIESFSLFYSELKVRYVIYLSNSYAKHDKINVSGSVP